MKILSKNKKLCMCCMEEHDVSTVCITDYNIFKGIEVEYEAIYEYCSLTDELHAVDNMISENDISMKNAYRRKVDLLTTNDICAIRAKYGISQADLSTILGWGAKTITRYETHQVQDMAHDTILKKLDTDPEWFLVLLKKAKNFLVKDSYDRYLEIATRLFEDAKDAYLRKSIYAEYARFSNEDQGKTELNIDKVVDIENYLVNSKRVSSLYKVKLMKLLWYIDSLSFKRRGHSMTGLVYSALTRGAVPVAHKLIVDLKGIEYEEIEFEDGIGYRFEPTDNHTYPTLTEEDRIIIDDIIKEFGRASKDSIVECMHREKAYMETPLNSIIPYKYALELSIH